MMSPGRPTDSLRYFVRIRQVPVHEAAGEGEAERVFEIPFIAKGL